MHIWNQIDVDVFPRRFKSVIEATYENFFADCSIEPIADYRAFSVKLKEIDKITEIHAKVHPPNPLFGRLWKSLNKYIEKRNASEIIVKESSETPEGLKTKIVQHLDGILNDCEYGKKVRVDIADAALLMAADGYGAGKVTGMRDDNQIVIKTSDTQKSFLFDQEPEPAGLADQASKLFANVSQERSMRH